MTLTVDTALSKLSPLMPDRVAKWRRTLALTSAHTRSLVERQILSVYFRHLAGTTSGQFLLPPPPAVKTKQFPLGTVVYHQDAGSFGLDADDLLHHVAIFGRSGAGKTNVAYLLMSQLIEQRIPFLFLDWKRTARDLLKQYPQQVSLFTAGRSIAPLPFDLFLLPPGMEKSTFVQMAVDVIASAYTLGDGAMNLLTKAVSQALQDAENPSSRSVLEHLHALPVGGRSAGWKTSAVRAMESIVFTQGTPATPWTKPESKLLQMHTILELDAVSSNYKQCLIPLLCLYLVHAHLAGPREQLRFVLFVEEAHHLLHQQRAKQESVMEMLLRQCRELGIGVIILDQHPHLISPAVLGNTASTIFLNLKDPKDITTAGKLALIPESDRHHLSQLPLGTGIVKLQTGYRKPFMVSFAKYHLEKGLIQDHDLQALTASSATLSASLVPQQREHHALAESRVPDQHVSPDHIHFLRDVHDHPYDGVDARYKRLAWSADKGNRVKRMLLAKNLLSEEAVTINRTRRLLLRVPPFYRHALSSYPREQRRESLLHEFWKHVYAEQYSKQGYHVQMEAPRHNGRMDILAHSSTTSIAIEIETGKSDVVQNVRQDLLSPVDQILVIATDTTVQAALIKQLQAAELFPHERVTVKTATAIDSVLPCQAWTPASSSETVERETQPL